MSAGSPDGFGEATDDRLRHADWLRELREDVASRVAISLVCLKCDSAG